MNRLFKKKVAAVLLTTTLVVPILSPLSPKSISRAYALSTVAQSQLNNQSSLKIAVLSDVHVFPEEYVGNEGPNYQEYVNGDRKMLKESEKILEANVQTLLKSDAEVILVSGDLTKDSEKLGHEIVAEQLKKLKDAGKQVYVTNGNHDINGRDAEKFVAVSGDVNDENRTDKAVLLDGVSRDEFESIYEDFGFDEAKTIAQDDNSTSYAVQLKPGYRLIVMDTGIYGQDRNEQSTSGTLYRDGRLEWILNQIKEAKEAGDTVIGMCHHGIVEHFKGQADIFAPYLVEDYDTIANTLADAGMEYVFTGHFHAQDVATKTTPSGNKIMDIMTGSSVSYPSPIRYVEIDRDLDKIQTTSERTSSIEGISDFKTYSKQTMESGVPKMVSSLAEELLIGMVDGQATIDNFSESEEVKDLKDSIENEVTDQFKENKDLLKSSYNESLEKASIFKPIDEDKALPLEIENVGTITFDKDGVKQYIKDVCEDLQTAELKTTYGKKYKLMDVITYCLLEVYAGDEQYSKEMQQLKKQLEGTNMLRNAIVKILVDNKASLGKITFTVKGGKLAIPIQGVVQTILLNSTTLKLVLGNAVLNKDSISAKAGALVASLVENMLTDETPDNNAAYIDNREVDLDLSKKLIEAKSIEKANYTEATYEKLENEIKNASEVISSENSTDDEIKSAIQNLDSAIDGLKENTVEDSQDNQSSSEQDSSDEENKDSSQNNEESVINKITNFFKSLFR